MKQGNKNRIQYALCLIAGFYYFGHLDSSRQRGVDRGWNVELSTSHGGAFTGEYIYAGQDRVLFRIYATRSGHLLAERMTSHVEPFYLHWRADRVGYSTSREGSYFDDHIELPPTYLDWIMARLF
jgi:hypothetical protein